MEHGEEIRVVHTMGLNNCGGRCIIHAHVKDGKIVKLTTDTPEAAGDDIPLCACVRGLNYHKTFLGDDRLRYPMKRVGERGEGRFERISWEEAVDIIASEWKRIRDTYGVGSRYVMYATGVTGVLRGNVLAKRLLSLDGGYLDYYNSYSSACMSQATMMMYGTRETGNAPEDWLNSNLIILWGHNPAETKFDSATMYTLKKAKEKGIPIVVIDPRRNDTALALDAEWIPLRPATDAALLDAMAYVIVEENLQDQDFLDRCCIGFDKDHMPEGIDPSECYLSYLTGEKDGVSKTPAWAEKIIGVPAETIRSLAIRYATAKPAALIQGLGAQRHACGEQGARGGILLACMTGNVGVSGGWACGCGDCTRHEMPHMPMPKNPYTKKIPTYLWTEAVERGREMVELDGVTGGERLDSDVKMIINLAGNCLVNQHGDINRTAEILKDTSKCEFILCSDLFMTASAKFADILLPGASMFETENISMPWLYGDFLGFSNKIIEPLYESRFEYDWLVEVAEKLGLGEEFSEGRTGSEWLEHIYNDLRKVETELPEYEEFKRAGIFRYKNNRPVIAFEQQRMDLEKRPFNTPSGKVEIFSEKVWRAEYRDFFPAIPRYVEPPEGATDPLTEKYPLQMIGWHTKRRCHSVHDNNKAMHKVDPQQLWMHSTDAAERGIVDGSEVRVWNDRGQIRVPVKLTDRIMQGVTALSQGAWYKPDVRGTDRAGSINVLTSLKPTPYARGNAQHSNLVQVAPAKETNTLAGRTIIFLGSSVTYGSAANGWSFADALAERDDCIAVKEAVSGTTLVDEDASSYVARMKTIDKNIKADLLLCQLSTNDAKRGHPMGEAARSGVVYDTQTIAGAIEEIIDYARKTWGCKVAFYTNPKYDSENYAAMVRLLKEIQIKWGIEIIDLWSDEAFNRITAEQRERWMRDPIHPTREGYCEWWTPYFERELKKML